MRHLVLVALASCVLPSAAQEPSPWCLVYEIGGMTFALDHDADEAQPIAEETLAAPEPVRIEHRGTLLESWPEVVPPLVSPDGSLIAHAVCDQSFVQNPNPYCIAIEHRSSKTFKLLALGNNGCRALAWLSDSDDLLVALADAQGCFIACDTTVINLSTGNRRAFRDPLLLTIPQPRRLRDGSLLYLRLSEVSGTRVDDHDLVVLGPESMQPRTLVSKAGQGKDIHLAPDESLCWLAGSLGVSLIDLKTSELRKAWRRDEIVDPRWLRRGVWLGSTTLRPDGKALAITFWQTGDFSSFRGEYLGSSSVAVIELQGESTHIRRHESSTDGVLYVRGFCPQQELIGGH